ncbi:hypothetical protein Cgig2_027323 [Carnegiea gigantea]|uniref:VHS domain-containing protein n=1 Tax=Carnegiea gigantea TaxID=171969 RepID=A0A9Q1JJ84_9CARY|nr:hypothetical protein Cgig2_027323 [Carnegiea gigantea]
MDSSRRAVESYWRSRMIDAATSDEDKVTPVYKLEEICELLRSSPAGIVKEVSEFVLKRLAHKSPIVKQKALRLIKYSVGKSGAEFRREMQMHSVAVKQLLHYKGEPDPLKGDALNKAVRETAQDALSAIFSTDDSRPLTTEVTHRRMEGFGNTNLLRPSEEKKSLLSEVVDLGSASIKHGLSALAQAQHSFKKNDTGSYKGLTLQRSLTNEADHSDRYEKMEYHGGRQGSLVMPRNVTSGPWGQDSSHSTYGNIEATNGDSTSGYTESKTWEERLLETIVTSGGVRLQPTRDALQAFLVEAAKMDALALTRALESKLQTPHWQVRMRAVCVLEAIVRKKDDEHFAVIASYFGENIEVVTKCSESPQASLREKANRVLSLLGGDKTRNALEWSTKTERTVVDIPDLIDTGDNDLLGVEDPKESQNDQHVANKSSSAAPLVDDLFSDGTSNGLSISEQRTGDDPFADVSFHTADDTDKGSDLFAGMSVGENTAASVSVPISGGSDPLDIFSSSKPLQTQQDKANEVNHLMAGLSINENSSVMGQKGASPVVLTESIFNSSSKLGSQVVNDSEVGGIGPKKAGINGNTLFPMGATPYTMPSGMLFNQFYPSQPVNYGAMGGLLAQQQFMAAMANFQSLGSLNPQGVRAGDAGGTLGGNSSPIPDIFNANMPTQTSAITMNVSKEETKAFDFISDHLAAAREPKRVV